MDIWFSKDLARIKELPEQATLLDGEVPITKRCALNSFARSGSTLTRKYMENVLRVSSGSSMTEDFSRLPSIYEIQMGFLGDFNTSDSVFLIKTH